MKIWLCSILTAFFAYCAGSLSTLVLASNFSFRTNLGRLGRGNIWISNFRRIYGIKGFARLLLVEVVKDLLPILLASLLFGKENAQVGRALAGFCLVFGRVWPAIYNYRGGLACGALIFAVLGTSTSLGLLVVLAFLGVTYATRYLPVAAAVSAVVTAVGAVVLLDNALATRLCVFMAIAVLLRSIPALGRVLSGREEKLSFKEDISYKFDETF